MNDEPEPHYFTCPVCGGHYFGRTEKDGKSIVRCDGDGSDKPYRKCWRGVWPLAETNVTSQGDE